MYKSYQMADFKKNIAPQRPTPYAEVNDVLNLLLAQTKEILQDRFVGMYLYGSLASGDFNPQTSDIDFLVVTAGSLQEKTTRELESMHQRIGASGLKWAGKLEGAYVPQTDIRRYDPGAPDCPIINEGKFYVGGFGSDWVIQRYVIREFGVILEGPDPKSLIDPVSPDDIRNAVTATLSEWWFPMLEDPSWLRAHESNYHGFAVITLCRALHALKHGTIASKPVAIDWARQEFGKRWHPLIEKAVASQYGKLSEFLHETLEFIRAAKESIKDLSTLDI
jgi:predicted nucleotidyltransferase